MSQTDKESLSEEHRKKWLKYRELLAKFQSRLPKKRSDDFKCTFGKLKIYYIEEKNNQL